MALTSESLPKLVLQQGFDLFGKYLTENAIPTEMPVDKDKLRNSLTCEKKRLHRFAHEFPHEQHLLNLQSLLVGALLNLARLLSDETACISQYQRELHRIAVLAQELDNELAKAKYRKRCKVVNNIILHQLEAEGILLAAEKAKDDEKEHRALGAMYRRTTEELAEKAQEQAKKMKEKVAHIFRQLQQYRLHVQRIIDENVSQAISRRIEQRIQLMLENKLRNIVNSTELDSFTKESILAEVLKMPHQHLTPLSFRPTIKAV